MYFLFARRGRMTRMWIIPFATSYKKRTILTRLRDAMLQVVAKVCVADLS
jgi:hypothetical protein